MLLNMVQAADALKLKSTWVLKGIKIASAGSPDSPFTGRYTTIDRLLTWLKTNPSFVASHHLRSIVEE